MPLTLLATAVLAPLSLQAGIVNPEAIRNDAPETWIVEYPRIIRPFVVRYRTCLSTSDRRVTGTPDFEQQHRKDIPRCAKQRKAAMDASAAEMVGAKSALNAQQLNAVFETVGLIHVARGRDMDDQFKQRVAASDRAKAQYDEERAKGLILELHDASVVKSRSELQSADASANPQKVID